MSKKKSVKPQATPEDLLKKQAAAQAIPPAPPEYITQAISEAKEAGKQRLPEHDKILADGSVSDFWKILRGYIERKLAVLKEQTTQAVVKSGYRLEEAGFRYILNDQLQYFGNDIIEYVENTAKVIGQMKLEEEKQKKEEAEESNAVSEANRTGKAGE